MRTAETAAVSATEAKSLFSDFEQLPVLVLAVSGGPDSTALMLLMARWRAARKMGPKLIAVTIDHGLRDESKREAADVARLARKLGIAYRIMRWSGRKPRTGVQEAARDARYRLLARAARTAGASHILTAHTRDDQAETVLIRMSRGSGLSGLAAMQRVAPLIVGDTGLLLIRPLLAIPKMRLIATLKGAKISFAEDPSNTDPRFTRARLRGMMQQLAREGLDASRLALLARRLKRADRAIEATVDRAEAELSLHGLAPGVIALDAEGYGRLPSEIALRLMGRAVGRTGDEGPVELAKLEALTEALADAQNAGSTRVRRTLAGAIVTLAGARIVVERAPRRRGKALTTGRSGKAKDAKTR